MSWAGRRVADAPNLRTARDPEAGEIELARRCFDGDIVKMADELRVSKRALVLRMAELGIR